MAQDTKYKLETVLAVVTRPPPRLSLSVSPNNSFLGQHLFSVSIWKSSCQLSVGCLLCVLLYACVFGGWGGVSYFFPLFFSLHCSCRIKKLIKHFTEWWFNLTLNVFTHRRIEMKTRGVYHFWWQLGYNFSGLFFKIQYLYQYHSKKSTTFIFLLQYYAHCQTKMKSM